MTAKWTYAAKASEIEDGAVLGVEINGVGIALYKADGDYFATADLCTHAEAKLSEGWLEGCIIECPLHGGAFDIKTGEGVAPPVSDPIATYPVRVVGDAIEVDLGAAAGA